MLIQTFGDVISRSIVSKVIDFKRKRVSFFRVNQCYCSSCFFFRCLMHIAAQLHLPQGLAGYSVDYRPLEFHHESSGNYAWNFTIGMIAHISQISVSLQCMLCDCDCKRYSKELIFTSNLLRTYVDYTYILYKYTVINRTIYTGIYMKIMHKQIYCMLYLYLCIF